jgi:hypothetical protein
MTKSMKSTVLLIIGGGWQQSLISTESTVRLLSRHILYFCLFTSYLSFCLEE